MLNGVKTVPFKVPVIYWINRNYEELIQTNRVLENFFETQAEIKNNTTYITIS